MPQLAVVPPPRKVSLYNIEEHLDALIDSTELVAADQEQEFIAELERTMAAAKDKRDHVAAFIAQCEGQAEMAKAEILRLQKRQKFFTAAAERLEGYVLRVVMAKDPDPKGNYPKLLGNTCSFAARKNPPSVAISDEAAVPRQFKTVTITMPAVMWENVIDSLDVDFAAEVLGLIQRPQSAVMKTLVKETIEQAVPDWKEQLAELPAVSCHQVPGAAIAAGSWRLVRS